MKFGLIGYPIAHSLSPTLFKAGYDGQYPYELIEEQDFENAFQRFAEEYDGINVTAPFKELALTKADIINEECRLVGATNLLVKTSEGIKAYNSDYRGLMAILNKMKGSYKRNGKALIVGLGGAGKAAKAAAEATGYETVVLNRTLYREDILPLNRFCEEFRKADLVIYNLPVRIPEIDHLTDEDMGTDGKVILEANYRNPSFDDILLEKMHSANPALSYIDGREWLLQQAVTGYEIFTGRRPDCVAMTAVIKSK